MPENPIDLILLHEGGYSNNPNDHGGPTKYGITQGTLRNWLKRPARVEDVKNLTEAEAREIYETNYLTGPRISTLPEPPQTQVLDIAVNRGPRRAIKMVQHVCNLAGFGPIDEDGVIGPQTRSTIIKAVAAMGPYFRNALVEERVKFYEEIIANDSDQEVFRKGWMARANRFLLPVK